MDASFTITTIIEIAVAVDKQYAATITRTAVATSYVVHIAAGHSLIACAWRKVQTLSSLSSTATAIKGGNFKSLGPFAAFIVVGKINAMNHRKSARQGRKAWEKLKLNR